ncbi:carbamoyltransferase HypF [Actinomycetospora sp. TBRC 11914]|uniref:carbamoyltransferase HypF n=1 Tax=Actinomycetospora sp. TBRC 11914 TaxID=2729387 RepID=UPI00145C9317|nr:carbamoyltransferase HypF [Actinomycetospora sp. TBRC 11914]NMO91327.1 carbamoyltransferase HypF [Actinomycetospora sp. TBRC 11914]
MTAAPARTRVRVRVSGIVQGVGFRPFVHALAAAHDLGGFVGNDDAGVVAEVEGSPEGVDAFVATLRQRPPALAVVDTVSVAALPPCGESTFVIGPSRVTGHRDALVSADTAPCADCLAEVSDPADRRHRYAFTNCTHCGPRFTIVRDVPYDRVTTTMAGFAMCAACAAEYHDPADRRFHAQPTCCPACGPTLRLTGLGGPDDDPVRAAAAALADGAVLAVKGLGGYHLAARADDAAAVSRLRAAKRRDQKPFAVMVADLAAAGGLVVVDEAAAAVLSSRRRPITLLRRRPGAPVADAVAPGNRDLGVMLPYTPLHHLLATELGAAFVLTSGNLSDEPIAVADDDARDRLGPLVDGFLVHDRPIHVRAEDSVVRMHRGAELPVRRARGYAPEPIALGFGAPRPVLGLGAEVKSTVCLLRGRRAVLSPHLGDLTNPEAWRAFRHMTGHLARLFGVEPAVLAHDLHPDYLSTKEAVEREEAGDGVELVGVQHHHAHVAACLAEHGRTPEDPPVLGVAFDGTGLGLDGAVWGGELLLADLAGCERLGHLAYVPLPGGAAAVREPWRMAAAYLPDEPGLAVRDRHGDAWDAVTAMARSGVASPPTSSAGRVFDAVAALVGVRDTVTYEGQAAVELEQLVDPGERGAYPAAVDGGLIAGIDLVRAAADDLRRGVAPGRIAARFHHGLADATVRAAGAAAAERGVRTAVLSGGVFVNEVLLERVRSGLEALGLAVLVPTRVPCTDGGISLGQVAVAAAREIGGGHG